MARGWDEAREFGLNSSTSEYILTWGPLPFLRPTITVSYTYFLPAPARLVHDYLLLRYCYSVDGSLGVLDVPGSFRGLTCRCIDRNRPHISCRRLCRCGSKSCQYTFNGFSGFHSSAQSDANIHDTRTYASTIFFPLAFLRNGVQLCTLRVVQRWCRASVCWFVICIGS